MASSLMPFLKALGRWPDDPVPPPLLVLRNQITNKLPEYRLPLSVGDLLYLQGNPPGDRIPPPEES